MYLSLFYDQFFFYHNYFIQFNPSHACYQLNKYFKFIFCDCQSPFITQIVHHSCLKSDGSSNILDHQCTDKEWLWLASIMSTKHRSFQRLQETIVWSWKIPREHFSRNHMETSKTVSLPRLLVTTLSNAHSQLGRGVFSDYKVLANPWFKNL